MLGSFLFAATCLLAYANGANDNFKGVASLLGSDTADYRTALTWGTVTTFLGSVASLFLAQSLLAAFSGKGLVPDQIAGGGSFLLAIAVGAGGTVALATRLGFPISTTHGLVGAIVGAGLAAAGTAVSLNALSSTFLLPLLLSPLLAVLVGGLLYLTLHHARQHLGIASDTCVCVGQVVPPVTAVAGGMAALTGTVGELHVAVDETARCERRYHGQFFGVSWQQLVDTAHYASAGVVSFARGLNDTPKIAALLLVHRVTHVPGALLIVGASMAVGAFLSARNVAQTMGRKITTLNHGQGLAANLTTGLLVIGASRLGLPVSTTHVSVGSLFGIGLVTGQADARVMRGILLSWVITLPCAALLGGLAYLLLGSVF